ncbi:CRISPR system precrRNA processing endoribonuclease RAMP protein Cas6 [Nostoc sp. CMAA1605]|uniref:CRISPR system precrRNA processing endoribonuclease RAMP protein Cas6 n=1 Tax=Nostoc sp. CMAA1605 TaxID=2055159 RepID=UPI001F27230E|nr:CRISPR system precrRNA processing endoribonuclease RAMP protein Cas6 [Nostoc sp. CMAA1605]MCF4966700.1 CRISPR-associated protein Cas5 [Nostoc sp. CMAA1605]
MVLELISSPPKSTSLYAVVIQLGATSGKIIPASLGRAIHAQVMDWLRLADPQTADIIHRAQVSPFSVSGLMGYRRQPRTKPGDDFIFRIGLLDGDLIEPLLKGIELWHSERLNLGECQFVLRGFYTLPGTHPLADISDYNTLANIDNISEEITLKFLSPTSFKQAKKVQPFPLPELVFDNLWRRWNTFAPPELKFPAVEWNAQIAAFELKTYALKLEASAEIGAEGWVKYQFLEPEAARIATVLANFASFAGVGRKTAMGMGQVSIQNSKFKIQN